MNIEELNKKREEVAKARARFNQKSVARAAKEAEADRVAEAARLDRELEDIKRAEELQRESAKAGSSSGTGEAMEDEVKRLLKAAKQTVNSVGDEGAPSVAGTPAPSTAADQSKEK